ncbi:aldehyde dehydrogenase family protein [Agaribacterium haliotis]|uniref:aldehyde dehydrogenase family protein n=1 Tax=Agaribacterium haliotis TaxID=2013869 RepID=UPI000BB54012|nr:aldehyde dehydrogenase family protein [Agaribacterium haliotis]
MVAQTEKVQAFLAQDPVPFLLAGESALSAAANEIKVENPADKCVLAMVSKAGAEDANKAIAAADTAFLSWSQLSAAERAAALTKLAELCERDAEELAQLETLDVGKPIENARGFDVPFGVEALRYYAGLVQTTAMESTLDLPDIDAKSVRLPHGVVAFVFPWNFPLTLCLWGIAPALAAGNTVVIKPAELTPLSTLYLGKLIQEAGFPDGVINILPGGGSEIGAVLSSHPKVKYLSFTGSTAVGKTLGAACGAELKPVKLELGGKGAAVIFDDADLDAAAEGLAGAITLNSGQVCCTATRWIVHSDVLPVFVEKVKAVLAATAIEDGMSESCQMGPVVSEQQSTRILDYVEQGLKQGAKLLCGGKALQKPGWFIEPTLLLGSEDNICFKEEIFGPVAYLTEFNDEADAIRQVNSLDYGLANSVWTNDGDRAERVAKAMVSGNSWINAHNVFAYGLPYGGVNASGIGGGVNSLDTLLDYTRSLSIAEPK